MMAGAGKWARRLKGEEMGTIGEMEWLGCNEGSLKKQAEDVREHEVVFEKHGASFFSARE